MTKIKKATVQLLRSVNNIDDIASIDIYKGKEKLIFIDRHFMSAYTAWSICLKNNYKANMLDMIEDETGIRFEDLEVIEKLY